MFGLLAAWRERWSFSFSVVASLVPGGIFWLDRRLVREACSEARRPQGVSDQKTPLATSPEPDGPAVGMMAMGSSSPSSPPQP